MPVGFLKRWMWKRMNFRCWNCGASIGQLFWEWIPSDPDSPSGRHLSEVGIRPGPLPPDVDIALLCDDCGMRVVNDSEHIGLKPQRKIADL
ncbi:MAG: hypothetical protein ACRDQ2_08730 [Gaiellales bacterium]